MASFELTDTGIRQVVDDSEVEVMAGGAFLGQIRNQQTAAKPVRIQAKPQPKQKPMRPGDVVKAARARIREIKTELKAHAKLKRELAELERLVKAAKEKPRASIRAIDSRRAG